MLVVFLFPGCLLICTEYIGSVQSDKTEQRNDKGRKIVEEEKKAITEEMSKEDEIIYLLRKNNRLLDELCDLATQILQQTMYA